jgi:hypothetical protein
MTRNAFCMVAAASTVAALLAVTSANDAAAQPDRITGRGRITYPDGVRLHGFGSHALGSRQASEFQSTVVAPGRKPECPGGRLLISNDAYTNPGRIFGFNIDSLSTVRSSATTSPLPDEENQRVDSNDHDLVVLRNGDVLLLKMGKSKAVLTPKPDWFDYTYSGNRGGYGGDTLAGRYTGLHSWTWGPGARSVLFVWRSTDCGQSFSFQSSIDTGDLDDGWGTLDDGSAGMPQRFADTLPRVQDGGITSVPGTPSQPIWRMGGTDGPLAMVDHATDRVIYTIGVVGNLPINDRNRFQLDTGKINQSAVVLSDNGGTTWRAATSLPFGGWRTEVVALRNDRLAFLPWATAPCDDGNPVESDEGTKCWFIYMTNIGTNIGPSPGPDAGTIWPYPIVRAWTGLIDVPASKVFNQPIMTRSPSSDGFIFAVPEMIRQNGGYGYGLYHVDSNGNRLSYPPITPSAGANGVILHPAVIDPGRGPLLFYWYDIDTQARRMTVRARLITEDRSYTSDFSIASFDSPAEKMWFGDYHTAGGFAPSATVSGQDIRTGRARLGPPTYEYFPVWKQSDGMLHSARITYTPPQNGTLAGHSNVMGRARTLAPARSLDLSRLRLRAYDRRER